jgi:Ca2+-binding RTX toxin-like protein
MVAMKPIALVGLRGWIVGLLLLVPSPARAAPPGNDTFAARTTVTTLPFGETVGTDEATTESGEPDTDCGPMGKTLWYEFTPPTDMVLGANTSGSNFDTLTAVWIGSQVDALTPVACSDGSSTVFSADAGTSYLIQVGGWGGDAGLLSFRLREVDAGIISGTVTEAGTGTALGSICVEVSDADFDNASFMVTDDAGAYDVPVRPGSYLVGFFDQCDDSNDHKTEWYDDVESRSAATEVVVTSSADASGIDAALDRACPGFGFSNATQVIGTDGPDLLVGGSGDDILCGLGGDDRLRGGAGRDVLIGEAGRDRLIGGAGRDRLSADTGRDRLSAGGGSDFLEGGNGRDQLRGGARHDDIYGDAGDDQLSGGGGNDYIEGEKGSDELSGGGGDDRLLGKDGDDAMMGGAGNDLCDGDEGDDRAHRTCERTRDLP